MKIRHLLSVAALLLCCMPALRAQNIEGQIIAAQYGKWRVQGIPEPTAGNSFSFVAAACTQIAGNASFQAFQVGTAIEIFDADPSLNETVSPSAVSATNQGCSVTVTPTHVHHSFSLGSATAGLQEALNANLSNTTANTIVLTQAWYDRGGSTGMIATVHGSTELNLVDVTTAPYSWYAWNGSIYVLIPIGGGQLPHVQTLIGGKGDGDGVDMPEKGITVAGSDGAVAWDEDYSNGRFDCRNPKYAGGCLGATPQLAMQAFSDALVCYQGMTGKHARTQFPPYSILVGTPAHPTLKLPIGAIYEGGGGWGFATDATQFRSTYNNTPAVQFVGSITSTTNCSDGVPHTSTIGGGSYDGFSQNGCGSGGCSNVPGDGGSYPNGGPLQTGITINDADASIGQKAGIFTSNNGADGVVIGGSDSHVFHVGGSFNNQYFYFGTDVTGQNYQFSTNECHADGNLGGLDNMFFGPFEVYGTQMTMGVEYHHIAGICWGAGNTYLGPVFSQIEEIGVIHEAGGNVNSVMVSARIDAPRGVGIYNLASNTSFIGNRVIAACVGIPASTYYVYSVVTATPGSGQTPGTYIIKANTGAATISVTVASDGTVSTNPTIRINGHGYTSTPPTFTLAAGGTSATFTVTVQNYQFDPGTNAPLHCTSVEDQATSNVWSANQLVGSSAFPTQFPTADAYTGGGHNTWVANQGQFSTRQLRMQNDSGNPTGNVQTIAESDWRGNRGGTPVAGTVIDADLVGYHVWMNNTSATTLTDLLHPNAMSDLWIMGDGFTTMPYLSSIVGTGTTPFGAVTCSGYPLLMQANTWYHFMVTSAPNILSGFHAALVEQCESIDLRHLWVNYDANLSFLPPLEQRGSVDSLGDIRAHAMPALTAMTAQAGGTPGANGVGGTYTYALRVWGPWGTQTWGALAFNQCLPLPGFIGNPCFQNIIATLPEGWTHYQMYRETSTDGVATPGMINEQIFTVPQHTFSGVLFKDIRTAPINGTVLGSANYAINSTGGVAGGCGTFPVHSATPGVQGQMCLDAANGLWYWADADDHWKVATVPFANF